MRIPLSLYLHIPFCVQKCLYCDFLSGQASDEKKEAYVQALLHEIDAWEETIQEKYRIQTVFLGGGTPTVLSPEQLRKIGTRLRLLFERTNSFPEEFTIEANPGTITKSHLDVMKEIGMNRVSLGLQSAVNRELKALGRIHTYEEFIAGYAFLREAGFDNINIDLMADIPKQTMESYQKTLETVVALQPEHISSYSLIVEEGTSFYQMQEEGTLSIPDEETDRMMYCFTKEYLKQNGYTRYEISNYAKKDKECRHNLTYWSMGEYLGLGLGASSYLGGYRFSNVRELTEYIRLFSAERPQEKQSFTDKLQKTAEYSLLSKKEEMEEFVFLGLRRMKGISLNDYQKRFGVDFKEVYKDCLPPLFKKSLLAESKNRDRIYLTDRGIDVSNQVLAAFLLDE
jgi:oxygen-independent coproporphyrinogen-3 oxidase